MNSNIDTCEKGYKVLDLEVGADETKIKSAYRKLSLKHHPNKSADSPDTSTQKFMEIGNAHEFLVENKCWKVDHTSYKHIPTHNYKYSDYTYTQHNYAQSYNRQREDLYTISIFKLANKGKNEKLKEKLKQGASPNIDDQSQESPLSTAMLVNNIEGTKILLEHGAKFNTFDFIRSNLRFEEGYVTDTESKMADKLIRIIIEYWNAENSIIVPNAFNNIVNARHITNRFVHEMAKNSSNIALKRALEAKFSFDPNQESPLAAAMHNDNEEGVRILSKYNATFHAFDFSTSLVESGLMEYYGMMPEHTQAGKLKNKILEDLKKYNGVLNGNTAIISTLPLEVRIKAGASPNTEDDKESPLSNAILSDDIELTKRLVKLGAHFNRFDFYRPNTKLVLKLKMTILEDWGKKQNSVLAPKTVFNKFTNDEFKDLFSPSKLVTDHPYNDDALSILEKTLELGFSQNLSNKKNAGSALAAALINRDTKAVKVLDKYKAELNDFDFERSKISEKQDEFGGAVFKQSESIFNDFDFEFEEDFYFEQPIKQQKVLTPLESSIINYWRTGELTKGAVCGHFTSNVFMEYKHHLRFSEGNINVYDQCLKFSEDSLNRFLEDSFDNDMPTQISISSHLSEALGMAGALPEQTDYKMVD